ncbi:MAG: tetratricopeptide repeat protein [Gemmatales bacterium]|nr:tetratricopeptide repeat protein [Gemmatales bacterium]MCS7160778.1 tetratricopeptide repeat protein [Gemmatales bacterium]MDW8175979.1 tetratricopeptide repeat protein [Gemmatales bacterium]MDW8224125.1 tetratricopeptide repeat protein [Gemmatales bacterium]
MSEPTRRQKLEALLTDEPNDPFLKYALAMECAAQGDVPAAVDWFERILREHPEYIPAYHQYGKMLLQLGHQEQAQAILQRGIREALRSGDTHAAEEMEALLTGLA